MSAPFTAVTDKYDLAGHGVLLSVHHEDYCDRSHFWQKENRDVMMGFFALRAPDLRAY